MMDQQPQYFDPTAPVVPTPEPWWRKKHVALAGAGVLGALVLGCVIWYGYQWYSVRSVDDVVQDAERIVAESEVACEGEDDVEVCKARARSDAAQAAGEASVCQGLESAQLKNCVTLIALESGDADACDELDGDDRVECRDGAFLVQADAQQDESLCDEIVDSERQTACHDQFATFPSDLQQAVESGNPIDCASLESGKKIACEDIYTSLDRDADGLNRLKEHQLGTSDDDADTDGDGYNDGEEVASGHDPLK